MYISQVDRNHNHRATKRSLAVAIAAVTTLGSAATSAVQLEEVVVTAQKRAQTANEIGMAITTFTSGNMKDPGIVDTAGLAAFTPGFTYTDSGTGVPVYTLRGVVITTVATVRSPRSVFRSMNLRSLTRS